MCQTQCVIEVPPSISSQLNVTLTATLQNTNGGLTNIINADGSYVLQICAELGSDIQRMLCGYWCFSVAVESCGPAPDFKRSTIIPMSNCIAGPDCWNLTLQGSEFGVTPGDCGTVFHFCITMVALDNCDKKPIGIAGFCKLGPVMVY